MGAAAVAQLLGLPAYGDDRVGSANDGISLLGVTVIDGRGNRPRQYAWLSVRGGMIAAFGQSLGDMPQGGIQIDCRGKFVIPGLVDCNVHLCNSSDPRPYWSRRVEVTLEGARKYLLRGVTTLRETYSYLRSSIRVRDLIANGEEVGPRLFTSGPIVGWGGNWSETFRGDSRVEDWQREINSEMTIGVGENLIDAEDRDIVRALEIFFAMRPDFVKYGATQHTGNWLLFSPRQQRLIIETAHRHNLKVDVHAMGTTAKQVAVDAGADLIQHPDYDIPFLARRLPDRLVRKICERRVVCALNAGWETGPRFQRSLASNRQADRSFAQNELTSYRRRATALIEAGACISVASDNSYYPGVEERNPLGTPGLNTVAAIEGLVELGASPLYAISAATYHGAIACDGENEFGSIERGKCADLVVLNRDPSIDISALRDLSMVIRRGEIVTVTAGHEA